MSAINRFGNPQWINDIGSATSAVGTDQFYERLLDVVAGVVSNDKCMVVRYSRYSAPQCLTYRNYSDAVIELWLSGYYRFDPFYGYWREREQVGVCTLEACNPFARRSGAFWQFFLRQARIADEIAVFLPAVGRSSIALFVERARGRFTEKELSVIQSVYPVLAGLHRAHVAQVFASLGMQDGGLDRVKLAPCLLLVDRSGRRVYETEAWKRFETSHHELKNAFAEIESGRRQQVSLGAGTILQADILPVDFPLAPAGTLFTIEQGGLDPVRQRFDVAVDKFCAGRLTKRESQIFKLIMAGFTNEAVAKRLGIGTGTVKNHRKRLYFKLDITTERELFTMFLESLLESTDHIAIRQSETAESALSNVVPYPPRVARRRSADGAQGSSKDR